MKDTEFKDAAGGLKIAVLGAGVAGLTAASILSSKHQVTLFEKNSYAGGHTHTVTIPSGPDEGTPVDTGFIVFNDRNYPQFIKLLKRLGITGQPSDMSFSFSSERDRLTYSSYVPRGLFAQKRNLFRPAFLRMTADILRFNRQSTRDLHEGVLGRRTLGAYIEQGRYSKPFMDFYLMPMGAAIWSTPAASMLDFPAESFLRFFDNHGLLALKGRPHWMTVPGGSSAYVRALLKDFPGKVELTSEVKSVSRKPDRVTVVLQDGRRQDFDYAVIGAHADEALRMLADPTEAEKRLLGAWKYTVNHTVLHTDVRAMPWTQKSWASWNYILEDRPEAASPVSLTYDMNRLQSLRTRERYLVSLNRHAPYDESRVIRRLDYTHPMYTWDSFSTQEHLPSLNGVRRTFFCGSYFSYGFHEDAVKSALAVTQFFGLGLEA